MRSIIVSIAVGVCLLATGGVGLAHTNSDGPAPDAAKARGEADARIAGAIANQKNGRLCLERAKKAVELGAFEIAIAEIVCVHKLAAEADRLSAEARQLLHIAHAHVGGEANAQVAPAFAASQDLRGAAFEAAVLQTQCCDVGFVNKTASALIKAELERQLALIKKDMESATAEAETLNKAALGWDDVDTASKKALAKVVEDFVPSLKAAQGLFEKLAGVAINAVDSTVDGSDEHFAVLTKEGTTAAKIVQLLTNAEAKVEAPKAEETKADAPKADAPKADAPKADAPKADAPKADAPKADAPKAEPAKDLGAIAKFTEDLDELGVPTMNKSFKVAKARLESIARMGARIIAAAILVLKPSLRTKVKEKVNGNYEKLVGSAKDSLLAVVTEVKRIQEKLGGGGGGGEAAAEASGSASEAGSAAEPEPSVQAE